MTDREILTRVIDQANYGGFDSPPEIFKQPEYWYSIIFSHAFAKAFWGKKWVDDVGNETEWEVVQKAWQHHLQQMVLCKNPYKYLKKFLEK